MATKTGRGASAAEGALAGASIGSAFAPGIGTAIGAGVGALGGAIFGGDEYAGMQKEELEELKRRQELGTLGLSDEEMAVLSAQSQGRLGRQEQEAKSERAKLTATQGLGSKQAFVEGLEQQAEFAKLQQEDADRIRLLDFQAKMNDEARIQQLTGEMSKEAQENQDRVLASAFGMAELAAQGAFSFDQEALSAEELQANIDMAEKLKGMGISLEGMSYEDLSKISIGAAG